MRIGLNPDSIFRCTLWVVAALSAGHIFHIYLFNYAGLLKARRLFSIINLDYEASFGTWVSSILLLAIGIALLWVARSSASQRREWWWLGIIVLAMSCDEVSGMHERLGTFREIAEEHGVHFPPMFFFAWTIPALVALAAMTLLYARFLVRLPPVNALRLIAAAAVYFGGAVGIEMFESRVLVLEGVESAAYAWYTLAEEATEMIGLALGLRAVLMVLAGLDAVVELRPASE